MDTLVAELEISSSPSAPKVGNDQPFDEIIRRGQGALARIEQAHWSDYVDLILAHSVLRAQAMREAGSNSPHGMRYRKAIAAKLRLHGFDRIDKSDRSRLYRCADNWSEISSWHASQPAEAQARLNHPRVVLAAWQRGLKPKKSKEAKPKPPPRLNEVQSADDLLAGISDRIRAELEERLLAQQIRSASSKTDITTTLTKILYGALRENDSKKREHQLEAFVRKLKGNNRTLEDVVVVFKKRPKK